MRRERPIGFFNRVCVNLRTVPREILMTELGFHPVADIFPMMSNQETADLVADIAANGLRVPIWLHQDGRIIDGRNRYLACREVGTEPETRTYEGEEADLIPFVVSLNLHRRHLNESHRAMVAARIENMRQGERTDLSAAEADRQAALLPEPPANLHKVSRSDAADLMNVSERSVASAHTVIEQGVPELADAVMAGDVAVSTAADLAQAPAEEQREVLSTGDRRQIRDHAKVIRLRRRVERAAVPSLSPTTPPAHAEPPSEDALLEAIERRQPGAASQVARSRARADWSKAMSAVSGLPLMDVEQVAAVLTDAEVTVTDGAIREAQQWITRVKAARSAGLRVVGGQA